VHRSAFCIVIFDEEWEPESHPKCCAKCGVDSRFSLCVCLFLFSRVLGVNNKLCICVVYTILVSIINSSYGPLMRALLSGLNIYSRRMGREGECECGWGAVHGRHIRICPLGRKDIHLRITIEIGCQRRLVRRMFFTVWRWVNDLVTGAQHQFGKPHFPSCACATFRWRTQYHSGPAYHPRSIWPVILRFFTPQRRFCKKTQPISKATVGWRGRQIGCRLLLTTVSTVHYGRHRISQHSNLTGVCAALAV